MQETFFTIAVCVIRIYSIGYFLVMLLGLIALFMGKGKLNNIQINNNAVFEFSVALAGIISLFV